MEARIGKFQVALESLDKLGAEALFREALAELSPIQVVENLVVPTLERIGQGWNEGTVALSQIYMSGRFCEDLVERVLPPSDPDRKHQPRSAIAVLNDYHMLGKRIVYSMMRASGFELFDYGRMSVTELCERARADGIRVLLISVLMLPSALKVREVRETFDAQGLDIKIIVGGAPFLFDADLWREVGADAMGHNASDAVDIVQSWMGAMQ
ncbi:MAG: cobalamin-dependent protein [Rhodocyclaceae bacterium]|nr:cobalamin-dependent protein [Rhodocyclaceae bacterium]